MKLKSLQKIDWPLLREQKMALLHAITLCSNKKTNEGLSGILELINAIQDDAAKELGDDLVFGRVLENYYKCSRCKKEWVDVHENPIKDKCPRCGQDNIPPHKSVDLRKENTQENN